MKYRTEEERREANRLRCRRYYEAHRDEIIRRQKERDANRLDEKYAYNKEYKANHKTERNARDRERYAENRERENTYRKDRYQTKEARAQIITSRWKYADRLRGLDCDLDAQFVLEQVLSKPCFYCGETDWRKLGTDRILNSIGHMRYNVVPCCRSCNSARKRMPFFQFLEKKRASLTEGSNRFSECLYGLVTT